MGNIKQDKSHQNQFQFKFLSLANAHATNHKILVLDARARKGPANSAAYAYFDIDTHGGLGR